MSVDAVIIGGGVSGLAAAVRLSRAGLRVALVEQSMKLGGRCYSYRDGETGDVVDNGQHVLVGAYRSTLAYLEAIGTRKFLKREEEIPFVHASAGRGILRIASLPPPLHLVTGMLRYALLAPGERFAALRVGRFLRNWDGSASRPLAGASAEEWLSAAGQSERVRRFLWNPLCVSIMNEAPERASGLLFARALKASFLGSADDAAVLIPTVGQTELYVDPARALLEASGSTVETGADAAALLLNGGSAAGVRLADGRVIEARAVIAAVPPPALQKILGTELASRAPFDALGSFATSPIVSIHLWFDRDLLAEDFVGLIDRDLQWVFNRRRIVGGGGTAGYLSGVISAAYGHVDLPKEELVALALRDIELIAPGCRDTRLLSSVVIKEKRATISATADADARRPAASTPIVNFFIAGDWTQTGYPATIEGAIRSGESAAELVLSRS